MKDNKVNIVFYALTLHGYKNGLMYLNEKNIPLANVVLIKGESFYSKEYSWRLIYEVDKVSCFFEKSLRLINSNSILYLIRSFKTFRFLKKEKDNISNDVDFMFSNYNNIPTILAYNNFGNVKSAILVDDGMVVFKTIKNRFKSKKPIEINSIMSKYSLLNILIKFLLGLLKFNFPDIPSITYYTVFPVKEKIPYYDKYISAQTSKCFESFLHSSGEIHFVSQPLVSLGIIENEIFRAALKAISIKARLILYFPHRFETELEFRIVREFKNIKIVNSTVSYEEYINKNNEIPCQIYTFYSSVLYTLYYLPEVCRISYIEIPVEKISVAYREQITEVFQYLENDTRFTKVALLK